MYDVKSYVNYEKALLKDRFEKFKNKIHSEDAETMKRHTVVILNMTEEQADSSMYIKQIVKDCEYYGLDYIVIERYNYDFEIHRYWYLDAPMIVVSRNKDDLIDLNPFTDVEGCLTNSEYIPAVAKGMIDFLINQYETIEDKNVLVIGRGPTMGSRCYKGFLAHNANVITAHSKTSKIKLRQLMSISDIVITATNIGNQFDFLDFPNEHQIVIDAGTCFDENGKLCGNCKKEVYEMMDKTIGVPGGVGLLTRLALFQNIYKNFSQGSSEG